jgi:hypothetical protein
MRRNIMQSSKRFGLLAMFVFSMILIHSTAVYGLNEYPMAPPSQPARVGGKIWVDGVRLTQKTDSGYRIVIKDKNGKVYSDGIGNKSTNASGLNRHGFYMVNIPIASVGADSHGAMVGDRAVIHVYKDSKKLTVVKPKGGRFLVGNEGSIQQLDIKVVTSK